MQTDAFEDVRIEGQLNSVGIETIDLGRDQDNQPETLQVRQVRVEVHVTEGFLVDLGAGSAISLVDIFGETIRSIENGLED